MRSRAIADVWDAVAWRTADAAGPRSDLYREPAPFQGRSLEGAPPRDDPKELARPLDAHVPAEDLVPVQTCADERDTKPDGASGPVADAARDDHALIELRAAYAKDNRAAPSRRRDAAFGRAGGLMDAQATEATGDHWTARASAQRSAPISFDDDSSRMLALPDHETASSPDWRAHMADSTHGADLLNEPDSSHAAHCVPEPQGWQPDCETGFGRVWSDWNEFPFSCRERILDALSNGESLRLDHIAGWESGIGACHAAYGGFRSAQHRAMVNLIANLGDGNRHALWRMQGLHDERLSGLIGMLDYAAVV